MLDPQRPRLLLPVLALAPLLGLGACGNTDGAAPAEEVTGSLQRHEATRVRVRPVVRQEVQRALELTTWVESERQVEIQPQASGIVVELLAEEGDRVENGQVLARLDQRDAKAMLDDAKIALQEAKEAQAKGEIARRDVEGQISKNRLTFEQAKRDYERNAEARMISALEIERLKLAMETAQQDLDASVLARDGADIDLRTQATAIDRAQLAVERAEIALSQTELRAPFAGVIASRGIQVGDQAGPGEVAFMITDLDDLRTVFLRPQRELGLFAPARAAEADDDDVGGGALGFAAIEVTAESEALPGTTFHGHIERISPDIDATSGSFRVTVRLEEESEGRRLLPGMLLRLRLVTERHADALTVPKRALRREGESTILFVADGDVARRVAVEEGFSSDDRVEVTPREAGELEEGMQVVVVGNRDLEDGKEIEVNEWDDLEDPAEEEAQDEAPDLPEEELEEEVVGEEVSTSSDDEEPAEASDGSE